MFSFQHQAYSLHLWKEARQQETSSKETSTKNKLETEFQKAACPFISSFQFQAFDSFIFSSSTRSSYLFIELLTNRQRKTLTQEMKIWQNLKLLGISTVRLVRAQD